MLSKKEISVVLPENFSWQGHRGTRGLAPENSIPAFIKALDYPVTTLELDLVVSKDLQLVVSHEPWFGADICSMPDGKAIDKAKSKELNIYQMTYEVIKQYDCGSRGHKDYPQQVKQKTFKPLLKEVVQEVAITCKTINRTIPEYNIELKSRRDGYGIYMPHPSEFVALVLKEIKMLGIENQCYLQSFDVEVLKEIHRQAPQIRTSFLVANMKGVEKNLSMLGFVPTVYSPNHKLLSIDKIKLLHKRGIKVIPWTINDIHIVQKLIAWKVDGIITDYPDMLNRN